jgi:hypothetical protein
LFENILRKILYEKKNLKKKIKIKVTKKDYIKAQFSSKKRQIFFFWIFENAQKQVRTGPIASRFALAYMK